MLWYTVKRILWAVPTVLVITLIGFVLLSNSPGDPVDKLVPQTSSSGSSTATAQVQAQKAYWRHELGLDLPLFYFSLSKSSLPDTVYKIHDPYLRKAYLSLIDRYGNAEALALYYQALASAKKKSGLTPGMTKASALFMDSVRSKLQQIENHLAVLPYEADPAVIDRILQQDSVLSATMPSWSAVPGELHKLRRAFVNLGHAKTTYKNYIPKLVLYGCHNQYHRWLFGGPGTRGILRGDFGLSYAKKVPVTEILRDKLPWSLFFSLCSIVLAYLISVPIGLRMAAKPKAASTKWTSYLLFLLYAMPPFVMGVLLLMCFANPSVLGLFPPSGVKPAGGYAGDAGLLDKLVVSWPYLVLPLVCYTYASLAFLSKLTAASVEQQLPLAYIQTAYAKGLSTRQVIWKHAFKNSLLPLITVFANLLPALLGGSIIVETIFTIPGMGAETVKAIYAQDYPLVIAILTLSGLLTVLGYLIADLLYAYIDPRIRLSHSA